MSALLAAALEYSRIGLFVLPLRGKDPDGSLAPNGVYSATTSEAAVRSWWARRPMANVGIAIDEGRLAGCRIVDVDIRNGGDRTLAALEAEHGSLPISLRQRTGANGAHVALRFGEGALRSKLGPGLELLGPGRYFVAAPSAHPETRRPYEWVVGPEDTIADAPSWLRELASRSRPRPQSTVDRPIASASKYARGALRRAIDVVERAPDGERNNTLNREAFSIARFIASGDLSEELVTNALIDAAIVAGLSARDSEKTVASALRARRTN